ncbi:MAG: CinA family protein [Clostridia bacterium]|nr:CinA family protein [Clostridia bacterium]MBQ8469892.1 CinA family protein [Clostridia bacterium]
MMNLQTLSPMATAVVEALRARGETVALAESCTGGLAAKTLTDVAGASNVFACGVVAYSEAVKQELLGVKAETLAKHSVISKEVALEMAEGVRALSGADYGIGITGVAGPGPNGPHPEGEIYIAVCGEDFAKVVRLEDRRENERMNHRAAAAKTAFFLLHEHLTTK